MIRHRILLAAAAIALAAAAPADANPLAANTLGGGAVAGSLPCGAATATGTVFNTVITGYVGEIDLHLACGEAGKATMSATGNAITGSTLRCAVLSGTYSIDGVTVQVDVTGQCRINNFPTIVRWHIDSVGGAGRFTVVRA